MSRTRILITEVAITKAGQRKNFQIKLPKNGIAVIGIANDLRMGGKVPNAASSLAAPVLEYDVKDAPFSKTPSPASYDNSNQATQGNGAQSVLAGKLLLQSLEKANIFYADQIWSIPFDDGIGDINDDLYAWDAFELPQKAAYKTVSVPVGTTIINGMFKDLIGASVKRDMAYTVKVLLWIETNEKQITVEKK